MHRLKKSGVFARQIAALLREDALLYALIGGYIISASIVLATFSRDIWKSLTLYLDTWLLSAFTALLIYVAIRLCWVMARPENPLRPVLLRDRIGAIATPRLVSNALLYVAITVFFGAFTGLKCTFPLIRPFCFDPVLSQVSRIIHRGVLWRALHALFDRGWRNQLVFLSYYGVWPMILAFSPLLAAFMKDTVLRRRYLLCYVLSWILLGSIAALVFMSAGPIFYGQVTGDLHRYGQMHSYLQSHGMARGAQHLWDVFQRGAIEPGAGISDFPSMHVAISTLATCLAWSVNRWLGGVMTAFTVLIVLSSAYLGWHYMVGDYVVVPTVVGLWRSTAPRRFSLAATVRARLGALRPEIGFRPAFRSRAERRVDGTRSSM